MSLIRENEGDGEAMVPYVDIMTGELFMMPRSAITRRPEKRPLGRLESDGRFTPRQPVLSSRTLQDIDKSGSRTYRAKSTSAIIEEQHQLLHDVYLNSRIARTTQASRKPPHNQNNHQQQGDLKRRRFLTINGTSTQRPWTSVERPKSVKKSDTKKKRPHTTLGRGSAVRPATDTHLRIEPDAAIQASAHALQRCQQQVRDLWRPDSTRLDEGVLGRGRGELWEPRAAAWLNFAGAGGGAEDEAGLVQAFTAAMRSRGDEYYTIDGTVGTHVARQLRRGDKVRVGINGNVQSTTLRVKRWKKDHLREDEESSERAGDDGTEDQSPPFVPLCWDDQVVQTDAKVLESRHTSKPPPRKSLCESRPVIFERLLSDDPLSKHMAALRGMTGAPTGRDTRGNGYAVRSRVKSRVGIDGTTTQPITNLTIEARAAAVVAADEDYMSVEDVLEHQLARRDRKYKDRKRPELAISNLTDLKNHDGKASPKGRTVRTPPTSARSAKQEVPSPPPSRAAASTPWSMGGGDGRSVRPLTAHSAHSIDQNFDSFVVTSAASTSGKPGSARSGGRATSGKRPPPAKPTLHRSAAAMGASIGGAKGDTTSYIQITQSLASPMSVAQKEAEARAQPQGILPPTPASPDNLSMEGGGTPRDLDLSEEEFPELESDLEDDVGVIEEDAREVTEDVMANDQLQDPPSTQQEEEQLQEGQVQDEDNVQYAFNIPTADAVEEEDEEGVAGVDRAQSLHDRLVEQTTDLLAGAIIGADLPPALCRPGSSHPDQGP